jgi:GMP synthase-like glutamine amidotransferase
MSHGMHVLSVIHGPSVGGGVFDEEVTKSGHTLERWSVPLGSAPHEPSAYDAIMVFGGSMHPDQDEHFPWLAREAEFLGDALEEGVPLIGVCLGAQLLARAAGSWVGPADTWEVGWHEIALTPEGAADPVLGALPERTHGFQWHHYTYAVPDGATELASSDCCTQAFRLGSAWGIQFHAEVTSAMVRAWVAEDAHELPVPAEEFLGETRARIAEWNDHGRRLAAAFLEVAAGSASPAPG